MEPTQRAADSTNNCSGSCGSSRGSSCSNKSGAGSSTKESSDESAGHSESSREGGSALLDLPREIITHIFGFLNYDEIAQLRPVCKVFDDICKNLLNEGFYKLGEFHSESLKKIKAQLPRRESERRSHRLARHGDILTAIETRLNLLSMTYGKFIDQNLCCFIPGRVIDEVRRIIRLVNINRETRKDIARSHEVLQELRDISSMAMEHFEECIQPRLRAKISDRLSGGIADPLIAVANMAIVEANDTVLGFRPGFRIAAGSPITPHYTGSVYQTLGDQSRKVAKLENKVKELEKRDREKDKKLQEYRDQLASTTASVGKLIGRIAELEKQLVETRGTVREDSCEVSTSRGTRFTQKRDANDLESCELQPRSKRGRRDKK